MEPSLALTSLNGVYSTTSTSSSEPPQDEQKRLPQHQLPQSEPPKSEEQQQPQQQEQSQPQSQSQPQQPSPHASFSPNLMAEPSPTPADAASTNAATPSVSATNSPPTEEDDIAFAAEAAANAVEEADAEQQRLDQSLLRCRICGQGTEGRPILRFWPLHHPAMATARSSPTIPSTFSQDICLHIFCGKTASILPSVNRPELEILTKAGLKNKHGIGAEVNAALARTRCARLIFAQGTSPSSVAAVKEKQYYLVREFEAHLAAIRHNHLNFLAPHHLRPPPPLPPAAPALPITATLPPIPSPSIGTNGLPHQHQHQHQHQPIPPLPPMDLPAPAPLGQALVPSTIMAMPSDSLPLHLNSLDGSLSHKETQASLANMTMPPIPMLGPHTVTATNPLPVAGEPSPYPMVPAPTNTLFTSSSSPSSSTSNSSPPPPSSSTSNSSPPPPSSSSSIVGTLDQALPVVPPKTSDSHSLSHDHQLIPPHSPPQMTPQPSVTTTAAQGEPSKIIPARASAGRTITKQQTQAETASYLGSSVVLQQSPATSGTPSLDGKAACGCGGFYLPTATDGITSWRHHLTTQRHRKWIESHPLSHGTSTTDV